MKKPIYLDYNGTTPHAPEVIDAMQPYLDREFGNPSSSHWYGIRPKQAVEVARRQVAGLIGCDAGEVIFTSGGTESNNQVLKSIAGGRFVRGRHLITSRIEHPAVLAACRYMEGLGFLVTYLPVDDTGLVNPADVAGAIIPETILISIMHANNEVGTIQPIAEIAALARQAGIMMHTDAAQSLGKIRAEVGVLGVDLMSMAGHKLYAPKGIGALYIRKGVEANAFCHGAGQERGLRAGTENVLGIVGLGKACELAATLDNGAAHLKNMRNRLEAILRSELSDIRFNGHPELRLPNTTSVSFFKLEANLILERIGLEVAASAGAACHSDHVEISHVLTAMNISKEWAKGTLRFTTGRMTTAEEIDQAAGLIVKAVKELRSEYSP